MTADVFADVFADSPAEEKKEERPTVTAAEGKITITLKGGAGFDAPWIVIHASDIPDAYEQLSGDNAALLADLMGKVKSAAQHFSGGSSAPQTRSAPAQATEAPAGTPAAPGPDWVYKTGVNAKTGKTWKAWMPPRGSNENPVWL